MFNHSYSSIKQVFLSPFIDTVILKFNRHEDFSFQKDIVEAVKTHSTRYVLTMWLRALSNFKTSVA